MSLSIFDAARDAPGELALVAGQRELSFAELAERVERRLAGLAARGYLDPTGERPAALVAELSLDTVETLFALFAAGTPALLLHPRLTTRERGQLVERAGARAIEPETPAAFYTPALEPGDPERIAAILATSGTTGAPRLARLSHRALVAAARASALHLGVDLRDRWLLTLPIAHVSGLSILTRSLWARRAVVLFERPAGALLEHAGELARTIAEQRVTLVSLVPPLLDRLLSLEPPPALETLRAALVGGTATPRALVVRAVERGVPVLTTYGLTETCGQVATRPYAERLSLPDRDGELMPAGAPLPGVELSVDEGLVKVGGPTLFSGYAGDPASPLLDSFTTRDRGHFTPAGELVITGRAEDLIITGGENVDPVEVEAALLSLPGIEDACVVGLGDPVFGERVVAILVGPAAISLPSLRSALTDKLAAFKLPRALATVAALPRLPSGKIDRRGTTELARRMLDDRSRGGYG